MLKKFLKYLIVIILFLPISCYAKEIVNYKNAKIKFEVDTATWTEEALSQERNYIDKKWSSGCGTIMTGTYDIYNEFLQEEAKKIPRKYFNYINLLNDETNVKDILNYIDSEIPINNIKYEDYQMKFIKLDGTLKKSLIDINYTTYLTVNNGYMFILQYMRTDAFDSIYFGNNDCGNMVSEIISSANSTTQIKKWEDNNMGFFDILIRLLIAVGLTFICYTAYPFVRIVLMNKKYNEKEMKKMILWNSIIVGFIFLVLTTSIYGNGVWNAGPAFLYYWVNMFIWSIKNTKKDDNSMCGHCGAIVKDSATKCPKCGVSFVDDEIDEEDNEVEEEGSICGHCRAIVKDSATKCPKCGVSFVDDEIDECDSEAEEKTDEESSKVEKQKYTSVCSNCGTKVKDSDKKCPKCGESFDDNEDEPVKEKTDMDKKYSDLKKLKKLLDDDIITKKEFEEEKKKILK